MNEQTLTELLEESISLAIEDGTIETCEKFSGYMADMLPVDVLNALQELNGDASFMRTLWEDRFEVTSSKSDASSLNDDNDILLEEGCCAVCERLTKLTRHHLFPREMHKRLRKDGFGSDELNSTVMDVCRMCHNAIHKLFTNDELAYSFYSLDLLLADERFLKYAKWASKQKTARMR